MDHKNRLARALLAVLLTFLIALIGYTAYLQKASALPPDSSSLLYRFPTDLNCYMIRDSSYGETWNGITIGKSTWFAVSIRLRAIGVRDGLRGNIAYRGTSHWEQACYYRGKVSAIHVINGDFPARRLTDWITIYGDPDIVTWIEYGSRAVIWADEGLMAVTEFEVPGSAELNNTFVNSFYLFSPFPIEQIEDSWIVTSLPSDPPAISENDSDEAAKDNWILTEEMLLEDPWGIATYSP